VARPAGDRLLHDARQRGVRMRVVPRCQRTYVAQHTTCYSTDGHFTNLKRVREHILGAKQVGEQKIRFHARLTVSQRCRDRRARMNSWC